MHCVTWQIFTHHHDSLIWKKSCLEFPYHSSDMPGCHPRHASSPRPKEVGYHMSRTWLWIIPAEGTQVKVHHFDGLKSLDKSDFGLMITGNQIWLENPMLNESIIYQWGSLQYARFARGNPPAISAHSNYQRSFRVSASIAHTILVLSGINQNWNGTYHLAKGQLALSLRVELRGIEVLKCGEIMLLAGL